MCNRQRIKGAYAFVLGCLFCFMSACMPGVGTVWTGAMLVYDRHHVYKKIDDYHLAHQANHALFEDEQLRCSGCAIDLAVFNREVLLTGHVPTIELSQEANRRVQSLPGMVKLYNQLSVKKKQDNTFNDTWVTAKIRAQMMQDAEINPKDFKVVTADGVVYLMGTVLPYQADKVIHIARNTEGVLRVVTLMHYLRVTTH